MLRTRILLAAAAIFLTVILFLLPKVVVENDEASDSIGEDSLQQQVAAHSVPEELSTRISQVQRVYRELAENEKSAIFADSLAKLYSQAGKPDSAAYYANAAAEKSNTVERWIVAGDRFYDAYSFAVNPQKQQQMAQRSREFYGKVLEVEPDNYTVKTKMAMTYMSDPNPMTGIKMLREVLEADPDNQLALYNLGMLSLQSGQHDLAIERLEKLVKLDPMQAQAHLLLGIAWMNKGDKKKAESQFKKVKEISSDPAVTATVDSYLKELK